MTDRLNALTVVLETDIREDDAQTIINAIMALRDVLSVSVHVADLQSHIAEERARRALGQKLLNVIYPKESNT